MARPLRAEHSGAIWHVTARGNERREVFRADADRIRFLEVLGAVIDRFRWRLHAFVLMENHFHLLVETPLPILGRGMRQTSGVYTQWFNRRHGRVGHLFQGRYKAILVERETHLLELVRYVVLNPVRAKLARTPQEWPWSSYKATAGLEPGPAWLETGWTLENFGPRRSEAARRFAEFVAEGKGARYDPWALVRNQIFLGSEGFLREVKRKVVPSERPRGIARAQFDLPASPAEVVRAVSHLVDRSLDELKAQPRLLIRERRLLASALRQHAQATLREIGSLLGVGDWQASVLATQGDEALGHNPRASARLAELLQPRKRRGSN